jgi:hypothetical protein
MNSNPKASCRDCFRNLNILPFFSQYIFSLLLFAVKNIHLFTINAEIHAINTRLTISKIYEVQKGCLLYGYNNF